MYTYSYRPQGVCSRNIEITLTEDGIIDHVRFEGGCSGNTQGVASLLHGMTAKEAMERLRGIRCGARMTSCPDQLSRALEEALASMSR